MAKITSIRNLSAKSNPIRRIRTTGPSHAPRERRIFNLPPVVLWIVALLVAIEAVSQLVAPQPYLEILQRFAFVPGRFTFAFDPDRVTAAFNAIPEDAEFRAQAARFFLGDGKPQWWTPLTYAFLHGGWLHVGMNCLWFVGLRLGRRAPLWNAALSAFLRGRGHCRRCDALCRPTWPICSRSWAPRPRSPASWRRRCVSCFNQGRRSTNRSASRTARMRIIAYRQPALPLREILSNRSAISFLGFWFLANFLFGTIPMPLGITDATVAWEAHIGGFLVGLLAFRWFDPPAAVLRRALKRLDLGIV